MKKFIWGDDIKWAYTHHLNSRQTTRITREGTFYGLIKHTSKHWSKFGSEQMALVLFNGNKRQSKVRLSELKKV